MILLSASVSLYIHYHKRTRMTYIIRLELVSNTDPDKQKKANKTRIKILLSLTISFIKRLLYVRASSPRRRGMTIEFARAPKKRNFYTRKFISASILRAFSFVVVVAGPVPKLFACISRFEHRVGACSRRIPNLLSRDLFFSHKPSKYSICVRAQDDRRISATKRCTRCWWWWWCSASLENVVLIFRSKSTFSYFGQKKSPNEGRVEFMRKIFCL